MNRVLRWIMLVALVCPTVAGEMTQAEQDEIWRKAMAESEAAPTREERLRQAQLHNQKIISQQVQEEIEKKRVAGEEEQGARLLAHHEDILARFHVDLRILPRSIDGQFQAAETIPATMRGSYFPYAGKNSDGDDQIRKVAAFTLGTRTAEVLVEDTILTIILTDIYHAKIDGVPILFIRDWPGLSKPAPGLLLVGGSDRWFVQTRGVLYGKIQAHSLNQLLFIPAHE